MADTKAEWIRKLGCKTVSKILFTNELLNLKLPYAVQAKTLGRLDVHIRAINHLSDSVQVPVNIAAELLAQAEDEAKARKAG